MASYNLPPWLNINPGEEYADTISRARNSRREEAGQKFEEGRESTQDAQYAQDRQLKMQALARQFADQQAYQSDIASGVDPKLAILKHPGVFSGRLPASVFAPPAQKAGFTPLNAPAMPSAAPVESGAAPDTENPAPAPAAPPALAPPTS